MFHVCTPYSVLRYFSVFIIEYLYCLASAFEGIKMRFFVLINGCQAICKCMHVKEAEWIV